MKFIPDFLAEKVYVHKVKRYFFYMNFEKIIRPCLVLIRLKCQHCLIWALKNACSIWQTLLVLLDINSEEVSISYQCNSLKISVYILKNFVAPFLDGFQLSQVYRATIWRQFTFYHSVPRGSRYSFNWPRKDERLS